MKQWNFFMVIQWIIFLPITLPVGFFAGAIEGVIKTWHQAKLDIEGTRGFPAEQRASM